MKVRVQVLLTEAEREHLRRLAVSDDRSLSGWILEAALEKARERESVRRIRSSQDLDAFFAKCDAAEADQEPEPSWEQHLGVVARSRRDGASDT